MFTPQSRIAGFKEHHNTSPSHVMAGTRSISRGIPREAVEPLRFAHLRESAITFSMMADFFDEIRGRDKKWKWNRHLDVGGAAGHHSALFRASGLAKYSASLDLEKYEESSFKRWMFYLGHVAQTRLNWLIGKRKNTGKFGLNLPWGSNHFRYPWFGKPIPDEMLIADFYGLREKYDIVTAFLAINHFDFKQFVPKVADLLNDDGVFFFIADYWWYPVNSTGIVGGVPYAPQQFTLDELKEHFQKHFPDELPYLEKSYNFYLKGMRPLLGDYVAICDEANLKLISVKRIIPNLKRSPRAYWTPKLMQEYEDTQLSKILPAVQRINPKVSLIDLETGWIMGAFRKVKVKPGLPPI
jgi:hypothetical protein